MLTESSMFESPQDEAPPPEAGSVEPGEGDDEDLERDIPDKLYFRIGEVAELVGVEPHVLRYWEGEFRMRPHRSNSGQRLYRKKDIARFLKIRRLLHVEGFTIAGARKALQGKGPASAAASTATVAVEPTRLKEAADRLTALREQIRLFRADLMRGLDEVSGAR